MGILTLVMALAISGVAAWYSIAGLVAIFASAKLAIIIMGGVLEAGKLVTASWLYRNWHTVPFLLKSYLTTAVVVLMFITSMGIFGFLSKAHLDQTIQTGGTNELQISRLERLVNNEQRTITDAETVLQQLDMAVQTLINYDRIRGETGAIATRENQKEERTTLNKTINDAVATINRYQEELLPLKKEQISLEAEVGPLKFIAELIYGDQARDFFDEAVRWVILLIVFVFDPLAVLLLIAANITLTQSKISEPIKEIDAVIVNEINDDWLSSKVEIKDTKPDGLDDDLERRVTESIDSKEQLKNLLNSVDQKLVDLYTHRNNVGDKKRSLQRLKKKIIDKLNDEESHE